jgi:predicted membrane protein
VTIGAGDMTIVLPPVVPVDVSASVGAGQIDLLDEVSEGLSVSRTYTSEGFEDADVQLTLDLDIAAGNMEVER